MDPPLLLEELDEEELDDDGLEEDDNPPPELDELLEPPPCPRTRCRSWSQTPRRRHPTAPSRPSLPRDFHDGEA